MVDILGLKIHNFNDAKTCAKSLCDQICLDLTKNNPVLALSGGKSPLELFLQLSQSNLSWRDIKIRLVDERIVPQNHAESTTALLHKHFLQNNAKDADFASLLPDAFLREGKALSLQDADAAKDADLLKELLAHANSHYIQPDIAILGMGADGHFASIFPPFDPKKISKDCIIHTIPTDTKGVKNPPFHRLSMSFDALLKTPKIYLLLNGQAKFDVLERANAQISNDYPISHILDAKEIHVYYSK